MIRNFNVAEEIDSDRVYAGRGPQLFQRITVSSSGAVGAERHNQDKDLVIPAGSATCDFITLAVKVIAL
jgi:hypothetical protein